MGVFGCMGMFKRSSVRLRLTCGRKFLTTPSKIHSIRQLIDT